MEVPAHEQSAAEGRSPITVFSDQFSSAQSDPMEGAPAVQLPVDPGVAAEDSARLPPAAAELLEAGEAHCPLATEVGATPRWQQDFRDIWL